jgi:hypothetical protein
MVGGGDDCRPCQTNSPTRRRLLVAHAWLLAAAADKELETVAAATRPSRPAPRAVLGRRAQDQLPDAGAVLAAVRAAAAGRRYAPGCATGRVAMPRLP